jgi:phosphate transport system ATP-binding protein
MTSVESTETAAAPMRSASERDGRVFDVDLKALCYGDFKAVRDVALGIRQGTITALIGPSGCGKSTILRSLNRMNDLKRGFRLKGHVRYLGKDIYAKTIDPVAVRRTIGMVFQKPNPFAMTIYRNVTYGLRLNGYRGDQQERVEQALRAAALWDEVKDKLQTSALALSGGQQQRLCIARSIATEPAVLLMDEPCASIDPIGTRKIEDLMRELKTRYTIVIVTHNLQQAKRVSDRTAVFYIDTSEGSRTGYLVECGETDQVFEDPKEKATQDYVRGEFA